MNIFMNILQIHLTVVTIQFSNLDLQLVSVRIHECLVELCPVVNPFGTRS